MSNNLITNQTIMNGECVNMNTVLENLKVTELKDFAKLNGVVVSSKMRKAELVEAISTAYNFGANAITDCFAFTTINAVATIDDLVELDKMVKARKEAEVLVINQPVYNLTEELELELIEPETKIGHNGNIMRNQYRLFVCKTSKMIPDPAKPDCFVLPATAVTKVWTSENRCFRKYGFLDSETFYDRDGNAVERVIRSAGHFIIVDLDSDDSDLKLASILDKGFRLDGDIFKPCIQSSSQGRLGKGLFTRLDTEEVRESMVYGATFEDRKTGLVNISKQESRYGLCLSSTTDVGCDYTFDVIGDKEVDITEPVLVYNFATKKVDTVTRTFSIKPFDGQATIEVIPACRVSMRKGLVTEEEYRFFKNNFVDLDTMKAYASIEIDELDFVSPELKKQIKINRMLMRIFKKIPSGLQIRHGVDKGLAVVFEHSKFGHTADIVLTKSVRKGYCNEEKYPEIPLEIANVSHEGTGKLNFNYQYLNSLNVDPKVLINYIKGLLAEIDHGTMLDANKAKKFLGLISSLKSTEEEYTNSLVSKLTDTLNKDETMLKDCYIQAKIKTLLEKYVVDMGYGTFPVKGDYKFIVSDPYYMYTDVSVLEEGCHWSDNQEGDFAGFRAPLNHYSEALKLRYRKNDKFWFLSNMIVLNCFMDKLPRAGGADCDGDKFAETDEEFIVNGVIPSPVIMNPKGKDPVMVENTWEERVAFYLKTAEGSKIGLITNYVTKWNDLSLDNKDRSVFNAKVVLGTGLQGREIDSLKTGDAVEIPKELKNRKLSHWMANLARRYNKPISPFAELYISKSPMGQLHDYVMAWWKDFAKTEKVAYADRTIIFSRGIDHSLVEAITPEIKELERSYRQELNGLRYCVEFLALEDDEDAQKKYRNAIYERYTSLMANIPGDDMTKAGIAYNVAYNENNSTSYSFPWITCYPGLSKLMFLNGKSNRMISVPVRKGDVAPEQVELVGGILYDHSDNTILGETTLDVADGVYEVFPIDGRYYFKANNNTNTEYTVAKKSEPLFDYANKQIAEITVAGFAKLGMSIYEVVKMIKDNNDEIALVAIDGNVAVMVGNTRIGAWSKYEKMGMTLENKLFKVKFYQRQLERVTKNGTEPYKSIKLDVESIGEVDPTKYNNVDSMDTVVSAYGDVEFETLCQGMAELEDYNCYYDEADLGNFEDSYDESYEDVEATYEPIATNTVTNIVPAKEVLNNTKLSASYWQVQDLNTSLYAPEYIQDYKVVIVNDSAPVGKLVAVIHCTVKGKEYQIRIGRSNSGIFVADNLNPETKNWMLRLVSYKCAERRMSK